MLIPPYLSNWFKNKKWHLHAYQKKMFAQFSARQSTLLIAPTGGGKTLASFLPSLIEINEKQIKNLHTLYISPLKALTTDIKRNLLNPIAEMNLAVTVEARTGDTNSYQRQRQRKKPPNILLITPESLMLLLSYTEAREYFKNLQCVIIDEIHNFAATKRGDLTALALAQLTSIAPASIRFGLSATVAQPDELAKWLGTREQPAMVIAARPRQKPILHLLTNGERIPYSGFMARYAVQDILDVIIENTMTIIFVNTRAQAEFMFRQLWEVNIDNFPIAIYHGSLSREQRQQTEVMTVAGQLRAIVATSALELGIDWGNVDCVIQVGAPKGISRLLQRVGRSNHQFDKQSKALLVPANCFDALECQCAIEAIAQGRLDGEELLPGALDVVVQFILNCACSESISIKKVFAVVREAQPYHDISESIFQQLFQFAVNGGYTLQHYDRYQRLLYMPDDTYAIASPRIVRGHRQNIGTIIESARLRVKILYKRKSKVVGDIEEDFGEKLMPGDTFLFAGQVLEFVGIRDMFLEARKTKAKQSKIPSYHGGSMPLSTYLANDVRQFINTPERWTALPPKIFEWLHLQKSFSILPPLDAILVESFIYRKRNFVVIFSFEGRRANHTLGVLMTRRMESLKLKPLTLTATDYGFAIDTLVPVTADCMQKLFAKTLLDDELQTWLQHSPLLKRTFRQVAIISGLIERQLAGQRKSMKQVTFSTDLIYDVLLRHEPAHILLAITQFDVENRLLDLKRLATMLERFQGNIIFKELSGPSPLAIPILTAIKTERVQGEAIHELLSFAEIEIEANEMMAEVRKRVKKSKH
jgi:ATP-dependent Lhr-like helicase